MLKTTIENYKRAKDAYKEIDDKFYDIENGQIEDSEFQINQILNRLGELKKYLKYIQIKDLETQYPPETIAAVKENTEIFQEALFFWKRFFLGAKYALALKEPLTIKYVPGLDLEPHELNKWGGTEKNLVKKIIGTLIHHNYIEEYEKSIKRIILGTMLQREFNRIFEILKSKMIQSPNKFISLDQFKNETE
jgi:hypothetical protein